LIFDIYNPYLIDLLEEHKIRLRKIFIIESKLDKVIFNNERSQFSDTKNISNEGTKNYLNQFRQIWN